MSEAQKYYANIKNSEQKTPYCMRPFVLNANLQRDEVVAWGWGETEDSLTAKWHLGSYWVI